MDRIEFNKIAKKIQSRLSRRGIAVTLEDLRNYMESFDELNKESELEIEQYWFDFMSKPTPTNNQSSDRTANLATVEKTETLVAKAAQKLDLTLTRDEVKDLAAEFTDGYSVVVEDSDHVLKLLKNWILHQEKIAAIQLARLQDELEDVVTSSHERIHKQVKGLLTNTKERQRDYLDRHKKEMESIYHFFGELMPDGNL